MRNKWSNAVLTLSNRPWYYSSSSPYKPSRWGDECGALVRSRENRQKSCENGSVLTSIFLTGIKAREEETKCIYIDWWHAVFDLFLLARYPRTIIFFPLHNHMICPSTWSEFCPIGHDWLIMHNGWSTRWVMRPIKCIGKNMTENSFYHQEDEIECILLSILISLEIWVQQLLHLHKRHIGQWNQILEAPAHFIATLVFYIIATK